MATNNFEERLKQYRGAFAPVVPYTAADKFLRMDFTAANTELTAEIVADTRLFTDWVNEKLKNAGAKYGIGGYNENRMVYQRSQLFGPSPKTTPVSQEGAKTPSQWEGEDDLTSLAEEDTLGYQHADPLLYGLLKDFVMQHRKIPTQAEEVLWNAVRTKKLSGYKFRRQYVIDRFIADLVCLKKRMVIEIDGLIHQLPQNKESDEQRTNVLKEHGFEVLRFTNDEVLYQLELVLQKILDRLEETNVVLSPGTSEKTEKNAAAPNSGDGVLASPPPGDSGGLGTGRSLHLGIDIWGKPYTKVMAPLNGIVHSFAFNNAFGDYGATLILTHNLDGLIFHTLYGHLSLNSIKNLQEGQNVFKGDVIAEFGIPFENGQWPPHLHFQIIKDMEGAKGDYPGVCALSERETYLSNCPDADLILQLMERAVSE